MVQLFSFYGADNNSAFIDEIREQMQTINAHTVSTDLTVLTELS